MEKETKKTNKHNNSFYIDIDNSEKSSVSPLIYAVILMIFVSIVGVILAGINYFTKDLIIKRDITELTASMKAIFPQAVEFDNVYSELNDVSDITGVSGIYKAYDESNSLVGYCTLVTATGFSTDGIKMLVGSDTLNQIVLITVLDNSETPGKGADLLDPQDTFLQQFNGKGRPIEFSTALTARTGATATSEGVKNGVNTALQAVDLVRISLDNSIGGKNVK